RTARGAGLGGSGKIEAEGRTLVQHASHADLAAVELDEVTYNGQPQSGASDVAHLTAVDVVVAIEDVGHFLRRNASTGVDDPDGDAVVRRRDFDRHDTA